MTQDDHAATIEYFRHHLMFGKIDKITTENLLKEYVNFSGDDAKNAIPLIDAMINMGLLRRIRFGYYQVM